MKMMGAWWACALPGPDPGASPDRAARGTHVRAATLRPLRRSLDRCLPVSRSSCLTRRWLHGRTGDSSEGELGRHVFQERGLPRRAAPPRAPLLATRGHSRFARISGQLGYVLAALAHLCFKVGTAVAQAAAPRLRRLRARLRTWAARSRRQHARHPLAPACTFPLVKRAQGMGRRGDAQGTSQAEGGDRPAGWHMRVTSPATTCARRAGNVTARDVQNA